jgi:hypothetical protein
MPGGADRWAVPVLRLEADLTVDERELKVVVGIDADRTGSLMGGPRPLVLASPFVD